MNDRILSETEHDAAMGRLARGEPDTWTPLVDHDTALRERLDANAALVDDLFRRLADTERAADTNAARVGELSVRLADTEDALREYAHHNGSCRYSGMHWTPGMEGGSCSCGLDAALGEQEGGER